MLEIYASTVLILAASLLIGRAILLQLGGRGQLMWLSGATGFAALVVIAPFLVRLPGRATTAAIVVGVLCVLAAVAIAREARERSTGHEWLLGVAAAAIVVCLATLPFLFNDRVGVLGEGIYTNDHAAQLYWADWLQNGVGPEPNAVQFGYPIGPQAVAVIAGEVTGSSLVSAFNGLLLAIPALTALTALGALAELPPLRRIAVAAICGLPFLAASFLAQSAFKETAMGLFVLAFALAMAAASGEGAGRRERAPWIVVIGVGVLLAPPACSPSRSRGSPGSRSRCPCGSSSRGWPGAARWTGARLATRSPATASRPRSAPWWWSRSSRSRSGPRSVSSRRSTTCRRRRAG